MLGDVHRDERTCHDTDDEKGSVWFTGFFDNTITRFVPGRREIFGCTSLDSLDQNPCMDEDVIAITESSETDVVNLAFALFHVAASMYSRLPARTVAASWRTQAHLACLEINSNA